MDTALLATSTTAVFVAGVVTSFHCVGMCGPLACSMLKRTPAAGAEAEDQATAPAWEEPVATGLYHCGRVLSYGVIGGLLGLVGQSAAGLFQLNMVQYLPWALAMVFLLIATGLDKRIPQPAFLTRFFVGLGAKWRSAGPIPAAGALGLLSPFLPCAPLYVVFGVALFTHSFMAGFLMMAVFALGTIPFFWLVQYGYLRLAGQLSPHSLQMVRQSLAFVSAIIIVWRALVADGGGLAEPKCPLCP